jgi:hypothetical protein
MDWFQRRAKFNNQKTVFNDRLYDSKGEAGLAAEINLLVKNGDIIKVEPQVVFSLKGINGNVVCTHKPDFLVTMKDGHQEVWEYKGVQTDVFRLKLKLFTDNFPSIPYWVVTANERYYTKGKRKKYYDAKR